MGSHKKKIKCFKFDWILMNLVLCFQSSWESHVRIFFFFLYSIKKKHMQTKEKLKKAYSHSWERHGKMRLVNWILIEEHGRIGVKTPKTTQLLPETNLLITKKKKSDLLMLTSSYFPLIPPILSKLPKVKHLIQAPYPDWNLIKLSTIHIDTRYNFQS